MSFNFFKSVNLHTFVVITLEILIRVDVSTGYDFNTININKITNYMETTPLLFKKVVLPSATLRRMKPSQKMKLSTVDVKTCILRMTASKLKKEGYLFRVSDRGLVNETIVECIKIPEL